MATDLHRPTLEAAAEVAKRTAEIYQADPILSPSDKAFAISTCRAIARDILSLDAGGGGEGWQTIDSAPKSDAKRIVYIMITDGVCVPDIVSWHPEKPARTDRVSGTQYYAVPAGWFCVNGGRSRFCYGKAKFWKECEPPRLPSPPSVPQLQPDRNGEKA